MNVNINASSARRQPRPAAKPAAERQQASGNSGNSDNLILWGSIVVLASVGTWVYWNYSAAKRYCYSINNLSIKKLSKDLISLRIGVKILNNSDFTANISGYNLDVLVNGVKMATAKADEEMTIYGGQTSQLYFNVESDPEKVGESYGSLIEAVEQYFISPESLIITIDGHVRTRVLGIPIGRFPVNISMSYAQISAPSAEDPVCSGFNKTNKGLAVTI